MYPSLSNNLPRDGRRLEEGLDLGLVSLSRPLQIITGFGGGAGGGCWSLLISLWDRIGGGGVIIDCLSASSSVGVKTN